MVILQKILLQCLFQTLMTFTGILLFLISWRKYIKKTRNFGISIVQRKAESDGLNKEEVMTLASIVDEETSNEGEMPKIAGMYINRLRKNMPLQLTQQ